MAYNPVRWLVNLLFSSDGDADEEPAHRREAKAALESAIHGDFSDVGTVVDYWLEDFSQSETETDYKYVFAVDAGRFGVGHIMLDPPESGSGYSQFAQFMDTMGASALDALDDVLGAEVDVSLDDNGTVTAYWKPDELPTYAAGDAFRGGSKDTPHTEEDVNAAIDAKVEADDGLSDNAE